MGNDKKKIAWRKKVFSEYKFIFIYLFSFPLFLRWLLFTKWRKSYRIISIKYRFSSMFPWFCDVKSLECFLINDLINSFQLIFKWNGNFPLYVHPPPDHTDTHPSQNAFFLAVSVCKCMKTTTEMETSIEIMRNSWYFYLSFLFSFILHDMHQNVMIS